MSLACFSPLFLFPPCLTNSTPDYVTHLNGWIYNRQAALKYRQYPGAAPCTKGVNTANSAMSGSRVSLAILLAAHAFCVRFARGALTLGAMYCGSEFYRDGASSRLRIPPDFPLGAVFGKGGSRIKGVSARTGARVSVDDVGRCMVFSGTAAAVADAVADYQEQFDAHQESSKRPMSCWHVLQACIVGWKAGASGEGRLG